MSAIGAPSPEQQDAIVRALVGTDSRHWYLYHNSASFHGAVDALAALLPSWVHGLAEQAKEEQEHIRRHRTDDLLRGAPLRPSPTGPFGP